MDGAAAEPLLSAERHGRVLEVLDEARAWGFLGPGLLAVHVRHSLEFAAAIGRDPASIADLGSGGGVPGLVLAEIWSDARITLVEANRRRAEFLGRAVIQLGLDSRVEVLHERAEVVGRTLPHRHGYEVVTARGFGPPAVTAECGAGLAKIGGRLVVSEPPGGDTSRWDRRGLERLGFSAAVMVGNEATFARMERTALVEEFPRRAPAKRPLW